MISDLANRNKHCLTEMQTKSINTALKMNLVHPIRQVDIYTHLFYRALKLLFRLKYGLYWITVEN
jgi:hypothetical protein